MNVTLSVYKVMQYCGVDKQGYRNGLPLPLFRFRTDTIPCLTAPLDRKSHYLLLISNKFEMHIYAILSILDAFYIVL